MIHENISERGAGFVRAWIFGIWAVYLVGNDAQGYAKVPGIEFDPPGLLALLPAGVYDVLITTTGLGLLKWVTLAGVVACAFGVRPWRAIAIPTVLLLTLHQGIPRGLFGYVNHKELGALYAVYVLALFPATSFSPLARRSPKPRSEQAIATTRTMMLLLCGVLLIPYCLVGVYRVTHNDMSLWSSDTFSHFLVRTSYGTTWFENGEFSQEVLTRPRMVQLLAITFPIGTVIEMLAPLCNVHRRFRHVWLMSMVGLHLWTWLAMDILFWENLALYPVLLIDGDYLLRKFDQVKARLRPPTAAVPHKIETLHTVS